MKKFRVCIIFLFLILFCNIDVYAANKVVNGNDFAVFKRTKKEIQNKWIVGKLNPTDIFEVAPSYKAPYNGGVVKQSYLDDVIDNLNYYRYLTGAPNVTKKATNRPDLQKAVVLQYVNLTDRENGIGLSHNLSSYPKPSDMTDEFYNTAKYPSHNIISSYSYGAPVFPFFGESAFTYTSGHRTALLNPAVAGVDFGLGNVVYGDVNAYSDLKNMSHDFTAYPSPGYFPSQDFARQSDWDIYLNPNIYEYIYGVDAKNVTATIENLNTKEVINYSLENKNLSLGRIIHFVKPPLGNQDYYIGDYKVTVKNLKKLTGEYVDITYTVHFFDKFEGASSNIVQIEYPINHLQWESEYNENLIKQFLPKEAFIRLENGGFLTTSISGYKIEENNISYLNYHQYGALPTYVNIPSYVKDKNKYLERKYRIDVVEKEEEKQLKLSSSKTNYSVSETATIKADLDYYADRYSYTWYILKNGEFSKIVTNNKYEISGNTLKIKNLTSGDRATYYAVASPGDTLVGFSTIVSKGYQLVVKSDASLIYKTNIEKLGWLDTVSDGVSGTSGKALRLEAITISLDSKYAGDIMYRTHVQNIGWESTWKKNGEISGTLKKNLRLEAIQIKLTGEISSHYDIYYRVHAQNYGWLGWAKNGENAGTEGCSYRLEAIEIKLVKKGDKAPESTKKRYLRNEIKYSGKISNKWSSSVINGSPLGNIGTKLEKIKISLNNQPLSGNVEYRSYIEKNGWESWKKNGMESGLDSKRIEKIQIRLTGDMSRYYDVYYRTYVKKFGWLGWSLNGQSSGTEDFDLPIEAIEIKLVKKGAKAPGTVVNKFIRQEITYQVHLENQGWQSNKINGATAGTINQNKRLEAIKIDLNHPKYVGGLLYRTHIQNIGWESTWKKNGEMSGTSGRALRLEAIQIKLTGEMANQYDIYYRVNTQGFGWLGWAKNGENAGTERYGYRLEAIEIKLVKKGASAPQSSAKRYIRKS